MNSILENIIAHKKTEVAHRKHTTSFELLQNSNHFKKPVYSLSAALKNSSGAGIIAEFKRRSPSKGVLHEDANAINITNGYIDAGACALSVLTDEIFFGSRPDDFKMVRNHLQVPIIRKDFITDAYQVAETKAMGADVILLIAAVLSVEQVEEFARYAKQIGLEVLLEIHTDGELKHINKYVDIIGINNRNLNTFEVSVETSVQLIQQVPEHFITISESGIDSAEKLLLLQQNGFHGFLIGEKFMKEHDPAEACRKFINQANHSYKTIV